MSVIRILCFLETGTRWKDYILVTLLLSAIIGCWYAYQQNKNAKRHLRRMAQDMEGLQKAEQSLQEMQKVSIWYLINRNFSIQKKIILVIWNDCRNWKEHGWSKRMSPQRKWIWRDV